METEEQKNQQENPPEEIKHTSHTYEDDLAKALDATDAKVIQQIMADGKEREQIATEEKLVKSQKAWYKAGAIILLAFTSASLFYSFYHFNRLTVPADNIVSVGVFPSTSPVLFNTTDIKKLVEELLLNKEIIELKPTLVPIVSDETSLTLLSVPDIFSFFESKPSEPFINSFNLVRLGIINLGTQNVPFVIASTTNTEIAAKELLIAEPELLQMLHKPLDIDISKYTEVVGKKFSGEYMYNVPVRVLRYNTIEEDDNLLFFYARVTDQVVVFTTKIEALKAIYDSLIRQRN